MTPSDGAGPAGGSGSNRPFFEELDYRPTPIGDLSLRRRRDLSLDRDVYEIKLGDDFLMSSLFTTSEIALARLGLDAAREGDLDVVVGGLGLGYTAEAALAHPKLGSLLVIELLQPVIDWHRDGLLPLGPSLVSDSRCRIVAGDFFVLAASDDGLDPENAGCRFDAILVDIDHSPAALLDDASAGFYEADGLARLAGHLLPGGVFALWSNEPPDAAFTARLGEVFHQGWSEAVTFHNPIQDRPFTQTVYLARTDPESDAG